MEKNGREYTVKHKLSGHRFGIQCIKFSPNMDYLISLGDANDRGLFVWEFQKEERVTSNRLGRIVNSIAFEQNQKYFVTAGYSHLKFWYFDELTGKVKRSITEGSKECILESFSADLSKVKQKIFVGVVCKNQNVYALTSDGHLYVFTEERKLSKWMNIKVSRAFSCSIDSKSDALYCACADGIIRVFNPLTL
jgi:WD40 repeat protein